MGEGLRSDVITSNSLARAGGLSSPASTKPPVPCRLPVVARQSRIIARDWRKSPAEVALDSAMTPAAADTSSRFHHHDSITLTDFRAWRLRERKSAVDPHKSTGEG